MTTTIRSESRINLIAGGIATVFGVLFMVMTAVVVSVPKAPIPTPVSPFPEANPSNCITKLDEIGFTGVQKGTSILVVDPDGMNAFDSVDIQALIYRLSLAVRVCKPGYRLEKACIGVNCEAPGINFVLADVGSNPSAHAKLKSADAPVSAPVRDGAATQ